MTAITPLTADDDVRTYWRKINEIIAVVNTLQNIKGTPSHLISVRIDEGAGVVIDLDGLVERFRLYNVEIN